MATKLFLVKPQTDSSVWRGCSFAIAAGSLDGAIILLGGQRVGKSENFILPLADWKVIREETGPGEVPWIAVTFRIYRKDFKGNTSSGFIWLEVRTPAKDVYWPNCAMFSIKELEQVRP